MISKIHIQKETTVKDFGYGHKRLNFRLYTCTFTANS